MLLFQPIALELITLSLSIGEVPSSNLGSWTGYPDCATSWISSVLPGKPRYCTSN